MIRARHAIASALLFLVAPFGCAGTETGNPPATDTSVEVGVLPPPADFVPPSEVDGAVFARADELGGVLLSLARVELLPAGSCDPVIADATAFVEGTIVLDEPFTGTFTPPDGSYCALRLWPVPAPNAPDVPELLRGHTFAARIFDAEGDPYVTIVSDRTAPIVLFADGGAFTLTPGDATVTLLSDVAGALVAREFWTQPAEPDGSWVFDEAGDAEFLRLLETTPELFRLFLGSAPPSFPSDGDGGSGVTGGGGGGGTADMLGPQLAASDPP